MKQKYKYKYNNKHNLSKLSFSKIKFNPFFIKSMIVTLAVVACVVVVSLFIKNKTEILPTQAEFLEHDISGKNRNELHSLIENEINPQLSNLSIDLKFNDQVLTIKASDFNFKFNADNIFNEAKHLKADNTNDIISKIQMSYDEDKLHQTIENFSQTSKTLPTEYSYTRKKNSLIVKAGHDGKILNVKNTITKLIEQLSQMDNTPIDCEYDIIEGKNKSINFEKIKSAVDCSPKDAYYSVNEKGMPIVQKEVIGILLPKSEKSKITDSSNGIYNLNLTITQPNTKVNTLRAQALNDKSLQTTLASFSTNFGSKHTNGIYNIKKSSRAINNIVILPGEEFSFQNAIVNEAAANPHAPYKEAPVFDTKSKNGYVMGLGGGICQTCTTLFGAALRANLPILQRQCHSQKVSYVPIGQDAAYDYGNKNLRFINNRQNPIIIKSSCSNNAITVSFLGKQLPEEKFDVSVNSEQTSSSGNRVSAVATQIVKQNGVVIKTQKFNSTYEIINKDSKFSTPQILPTETQTGSNTDQTNTPNSNQTNTPNSNQTNTPNSNQTNTPNSNQTNTPNSNQTNTPNSNQTNTPNSNQTNTPKANQSNTPNSNQSNTPNSNQTNTPNSNQSNTPNSNQSNTPKVNQTNTPNSNQTNTPNSNQTNTPNSNQTNTPNSNQTNTPNSNQTNTPNSNQTNTPNSNQTNTPNITAAPTSNSNLNQTVSSN